MKMQQAIRQMFSGKFEHLTLISYYIQIKYKSIYPTINYGDHIVAFLNENDTKKLAIYMKREFPDVLLLNYRVWQTFTEEINNGHIVDLMVELGRENSVIDATYDSKEKCFFTIHPSFYKRVEVDGYKRGQKIISNTILYWAHKLI